MLMEKTLKNELKSTIEKKFGAVKQVYRNEIYWCDLGNGESSEQRGMRPVIIVQNNIGNRYSPVVIVAAITSQINKTKLPTHVYLSSKKYGLSKDSIVLTEQIRTVDKSKLGDFITQLQGEDITKLNVALNISLELAHIEKTNNINSSSNNVTDITIIRKITEKAKEIEELDTTLRVLASRNIGINMMKPILCERQDKIREFYMICENNNIKNPEKYYIDYNKQKLENNRVKTI